MGNGIIQSFLNNRHIITLQFLSKTGDEDILSVKEKVIYFKEKLSDFDTELDINITEIEDVLYHKLHTNWIEAFNTKFIGEYERAN